MEIVTYSFSFVQKFFTDLKDVVSALFKTFGDLFTFVPMYVMQLVYSAFIIIVAYFVWRFIKGVVL